MQYLFLLSLSFPGPSLVRLEEQGVYDENFLLFQWGDETLLCHRGEKLLILFDNAWSAQKRYERAGLGPDELNLPIVFGLLPEKALILNNFRTFLVLDRNLQPTGEAVPSPLLPMNLKMGVSRGKGKFLAVGLGHGPFAVWEMEIVGEQWKVVIGVFPTPDDAALNPYLVTYHQGLIFASEAPLRQMGPGFNPRAHKNPDHYEIEVHDISGRLEENVVQILSHSVEGLRGFEDKIMFAHQAFQYHGRYFTLITFVSFRDPNDRVLYLDSFAENGDFIGRQPMEPHWRFLPIHGSDRIVKLNSETMELFPFGQD